MSIIGSDSFLRTEVPGTGLDYPHLDDFGYSTFGHVNRDYADTWTLSADPVTDAAYRTDLLRGALKFDLSDGVGGILTQTSRAIRHNEQLTVTDYEAQMNISIDPATMEASGVIALRGVEVVGYDVAFAGMSYQIGGGEISLSFMESDGSGTTNTEAWDTIVVESGRRTVRLTVQIVGLTVKGYVDGVLVGTSTASGTNLGSMEVTGEVHFVIAPTADSNGPPYTGEAGNGPYSEIYVTYLAVGTPGTLYGPGGPTLTGYVPAPGTVDASRPATLPNIRGFGTDTANAGWTASPPTDGPVYDVDSNGDWVGRGGDQLRMLVGSGYDLAYATGDPVEVTADLILPALKAKAFVGRAGVFDGELVLPMPTVSGFIGGVRAALTLPKITLSASGSIDNVVRADLTLPMFVLGAGGNVGTMYEASLTLPLFQTSATPSWYGAALEIPALTLGAGSRFVVNLTGQAAATLPMLRISASIGEPTGVYSAYLVLPALVMSSDAAATILLPSLRLRAHVTLAADPAQTYVTWAMNLATGAVTEFGNFPMRAMARAYDRYFGIRWDGGLYRLGGDLDDEDKIGWEWASGLADFGVHGQKGVMAAYIDALFESGAMLRVFTDTDTRTYDHRPRGNPADHRIHRVSLGKGVRTHNLGFGMLNPDGGYLELDSITPEYVLTKRNI